MTLKGVVAIVACTAGLWSGPALAQFQVDMSPADVRSATGKLAIEDLAVGEVALLSYPAVCVEGGFLFVGLRQPLEPEASDYGPNWRVRREPGNQLSVTLELGSSASTTIEEYLGTLFVNPVPCDFWRMLGHGLISVASINGKTAASDFLDR